MVPLLPNLLLAIKTQFVVLLQGSRETFRSLLCDSAARLDGLSRKLGSCIEKARPYYEARMRASEAAREAQDAAVQFERANSAHSAAREMVIRNSHRSQNLFSLNTLITLIISKMRNRCRRIHLVGILGPIWRLFESILTT